MTLLDWANLMVWSGTVVVAVVLVARVRQGVWRRFDIDAEHVSMSAPPAWSVPVAGIGLALALCGVGLLLRT